MSLGLAGTYYNKDYDALVPEDDSAEKSARALGAASSSGIRVAFRVASRAGRRPWVIGGSAAGSALAVMALVREGFRSGSNLRQHSSSVSAGDVVVLDSQVLTAPIQCGASEQDTDYVLWGDQWGMSFDHIPDPDMCCSMCQGVPECMSWTWVKDAGLDGCPSQCWLKGRHPDEKKAGKPGFVSGLAPPRPAMVKPATLSGDDELAKLVVVGATANTSTHQADVTSKVCGKVDHDTDYQSGDLVVTVQDVNSIEQCCKTCSHSDECEAWTWGKRESDDDKNSVCYLKSKAPNDEAQKKHLKGVVSGLPGKKEAKVKLMYDLNAVQVKRPNSAFCWSLVMPRGYEQELIIRQHKLGASIFGCDEAAVYSNETFSIMPGVTTSVVDSDLKCELGGESYTALNSWIFIAVWRKVIEDGRYLHHDWTVKVDPDAVFFPDRLRVVLKDHVGAGYINNCKYGMHGPIEVFGRTGVAALAADYDLSFDGKAPKTCVDKLDFGLWGEDFFLDQCLWKILKVDRAMDDRLMCEAHCDCDEWYWCREDSDRVTFHPFKRADLYTQCMANALGGRGPNITIKDE